ncbi:DNA-binding transcriptional LysR family regulator [Paraburkholderia sp. BL6669N2]|uniref:LysR family transcriptional regulator n=1 Tax=Paraburkholderia sp. BL6669N2 TaxID=1938807 RepID=UPI000E223468|nr:LysR family transcriptional regulator [Paraburkholderia sp. BL6669N2]REG51003.1 DNA-binding transcriptional LysR family regulator [Paraburkholderia sp. BL6669N2]
MDRIAAMNVFVRVVEAGTFTKAAETLDLQNATVTRLIQQLENDLKVRLLHRTTRSLTLTPEGASYYERVVRVLAEIADIESSTRQSRARPSGRIRVDTAAAIGTVVLIPALSDFYRLFPEVDIELEIGSKHTDLVAEGIDCAIRAGVVDEPFMTARRIGEFGFVTCATPDYLRSYGAPRLPDDLRERPTIGMTWARDGRARPFQFVNGDQNVEPTLNHKLVVNDANAYLAAGLASLGIIQAPAYTVQHAISSGQLVPVLRDWSQDVIPVNVVYAPNRYLSVKVRVFIDWVVELFERNECLRRR